MAQLQITEYTDPACPFAWSAEPTRRRLDWLYGDQLTWEVRMVGLADSREAYAGRGFTPERLSASFRAMSEAHHMPIDTGPRDAVAATIPACRAVVAVRRHRPERERAMLRALRVLHFSGRLLDETQTLTDAARMAAVDPESLVGWLGEAETHEMLAGDLAAARRPSRAALALSHKLAATETGYRYTCPSYELARVDDGDGLAVPGFQPLAAYEVAVANLLPDARRRPDPDDVRDVLVWAAEPLATAEVAAVCAISLAEARERLGRVAMEEHVGFDGLWHLDGDAGAGVAGG
jgi:predicted DsbA family dithiol-disulfide isomerase